MHRILTAAALVAALWGLKRWLDHRYVQVGHAARHPTETWENEGGTVSSNSHESQPFRAVP